MGIVIRQSAVTAFFSYLGVIIGYINVLWLFPALMRPGEIGLVRIIQDMAILLVPFAQSGLNLSLLRFFPGFKDDKDSRSSFLGLMLVLGLSAFVIFAVLFFLFREPISSLFIERSQEVIDFLPLVLVLIFILVYNNLLTSFSRSLLKAVLPNVLRDVALRLYTTVFLALYFLELVNFIQFIYLVIAGYGLNLIILSAYLTATGNLHIRFGGTAFNKKDISSILQYSLFALIGASGILIIGKVDSIMVSSMLGLHENGIYTTAFYIAVVIELPKRAILQIGTPIISRAFEKGDLGEVREFYKKVSINQFVIGALILIGIWINIDNIYYFVPNNEIFSLGKYVVLIVGVGKLSDMVFGSNSEIMVMSKYYRYNILFIGLLSVVTIAANLLLIPRYGMDGAAIGSAVSLFLFNFSKYLFINSRLGMQPFSVQTLKVLVLSGIVLWVGLAFPVIGSPLLDLLVRSIVVSVLFIGPVILLRVSPDINNLFNKVIARAGIRRPGN